MYSTSIITAYVETPKVDLSFGTVLKVGGSTYNRMTAMTATHENYFPYDIRVISSSIFFE
jgi:hypothetical protein